LGGGGGRQHRGQRFAGQRAAFTQVGGFVDPSGGVGAADQRRVGDRVGECAADVGGGGVARELVDQGMFARGQTPSHLVVAGQQRQPCPVAQHRAIEVQCGIQRIEGRRGDLFIGDDTCTHTRKLDPPNDKKPHRETTETQVTQGVSRVCGDGDCRSDAGTTTHDPNTGRAPSCGPIHLRSFERSLRGNPQ
jgi:hypothetical protein